MAGRAMEEAPRGEITALCRAQLPADGGLAVGTHQACEQESGLCHLQTKKKGNAMDRFGTGWYTGLAGGDNGPSALHFFLPSTIHLMNDY